MEKGLQRRQLLIPNLSWCKRELHRVYITVNKHRNGASKNKATEASMFYDWTAAAEEEATVAAEVKLLIYYYHHYYYWSNACIQRYLCAWRGRSETVINLHGHCRHHLLKSSSSSSSSSSNNNKEIDQSIILIYVANLGGSACLFLSFDFRLISWIFDWGYSIWFELLTMWRVGI